MSTPDPLGAADIPAQPCSQANGADDPATGWLRVDTDTRELLLDALLVASDGIHDDLDCAGCLDGTCNDDGHQQCRRLLSGWRALARHLNVATAYLPQPRLYSAGGGAWTGRHPPEPRLGPVMLDVTTKEPDGLGRRNTGQVFGTGSGVFSALNAARAIACHRGTLSVVVTEYQHPQRRVLFRHGGPGQPDLDLTPLCPHCAPSRHCRNTSAHYTAVRPLLVAWADQHTADD